MTFIEGHNKPHLSAQDRELVVVVQPQVGKVSYFFILPCSRIAISQMKQQQVNSLCGRGQYFFNAVIAERITSISES